MSASPTEGALPRSPEEYEAALQRARREGFCKGAHWQNGYEERRRQEYRAKYGGDLLGSWSAGESEAEARRLFPIRKKVPRVVEVQRATIRFFARASDTHAGVSFYLDRECTERFTVNGLFPHEPAIYADLLANPTEEVTE